MSVAFVEEHNVRLEHTRCQIRDRPHHTPTQYSQAFDYCTVCLSPSRNSCWQESGACWCVSSSPSLSRYPHTQMRFAAVLVLLAASCAPAASFMMPVSRRAAGQLVKAAVAFRPFGSQVRTAERRWGGWWWQEGQGQGRFFLGVPCTHEIHLPLSPTPGHAQAWCTADEGAGQPPATSACRHVGLLAWGRRALCVRWRTCPCG